jgi:hypothetical protein
MTLQETKMFDIRFHLGAGQHYKFWQIKSKDSEPKYVTPFGKYLLMNNCVLKNNRNKAEHIFESQRRDVCGFVRCESYEVLDSGMDVSNLTEIMFDPKIAPYWRKHNDPDAYDNLTYSKLITKGRHVYILSVND